MVFGLNASTKPGMTSLISSHVAIDFVSQEPVRKKAPEKDTQVYKTLKQPGFVISSQPACSPTYMKRKASLQPHF